MNLNRLKKKTHIQTGKNSKRRRRRRIWEMEKRKKKPNAIVWMRNHCFIFACIVDRPIQKKKKEFVESEPITKTEDQQKKSNNKKIHLTRASSNECRGPEEYISQSVY